MTTTQYDTAAAPPFLSALAAERLPADGEAAWAHDLRARAWSAFRKAGLPTRKAEAWKYTDLRKLARHPFRSAAPLADGVSTALQPTLRQAAEAAHALVFVNGHYREDLSRPGDLPAGVRLASLAGLLAAGDAVVRDRLGQVALADDRPFLALNTALARDGVVLELAPGAVVERPIRLLFLIDPAADSVAVYPRNLIVAGADSQATIVEVHDGADRGPYLNNSASEVLVGDGARVRHYKLQREAPEAYHLAHIMARLGRDATFENFVLSTGAAWARTEITATFDGPGGDCRLSGGYLARAAQHLDTTTLIEHTQPDCRSRQVYQGAIDDQARAVFQGKVVVRRGAQRTDGHQLSRGLLLSPRAEIDHKPELEIYADDVKCSHGATAGEIDHDALFYLRSRGLDEAAARGLLIEAFVLEAIEEIAEETVRQEFADVVQHWLAAPGGA